MNENLRQLSQIVSPALLPAMIEPVVRMQRITYGTPD
jgi:hypothetical protein